MATYYTRKSRAFGTRVGQGHARQELVAEAVVAVTTAMIDNTNDVIGLFYLPKGAVVTGVVIDGTDMDSNGSPTLAFDIGDSGSQNRLVAASTVGQAGTNSHIALKANAVLYKYTADTLISAYVQAAAATAVAGTLRVVLRYFVDVDYDSTAMTATTTA